MNKISKLLTAAILIMAIAVSSCKKTFDQPAGPADPTNLVANTTIKDFKARHTVPGQFDVITEDLVISGVVIADDKSGNLYKQLFIQDSTGAIQILLDVNSLYQTYPVGRRVFIKCKDLCLSDYYRTMQLGVKAYVAGVPSALAIPSNIIDKYVIGGSINNPVTPIPVTLAQLGGSSIDMQNQYLGNLVLLNDFEFANIMNTYADTSVYKKDTNDDLQDCNGNKIILRSSGYAKFAGLRVPSGHGSIAAIYTIYQSTNTGTKQLVLRDTTDVKFYGTRCGGGPINPGTGTLITMAQLRALHPSTADVTIPAGNKIRAKVISFSGNEAAGNYRLQDESGAGVILYAASGAPTYALNTVLDLNVGGGVLTLYNGDLELKSVTTANVGVNTTDPVNITPRVATCADITTNRNVWASTMVKINNVTSIVAGTPGTSGTTYTITDATGSVKMFVRNAANITVSTSGTSITGYVSLFNTDTQIGIRSASDIQ